MANAQKWKTDASKTLDIAPAARGGIRGFSFGIPTKHRHENNGTMENGKCQAPTSGCKAWTPPRMPSTLLCPEAEGLNRFAETACQVVRSLSSQATMRNRNEEFDFESSRVAVQSERVNIHWDLGNMPPTPGLPGSFSSNCQCSAVIDMKLATKMREKNKQNE